MLVIRPGHVSNKISVQKALLEWQAANPETAALCDPARYNGLTVEVKQVSKQTFLEALAMCRSTGGLDSEIEIYRAMGMLVQHAIKQVHGLEDLDGKVLLEADESGSLTDESLELLHDNDLVMDLWRIARMYNELSAEEKKTFSEQAQPI
tara:strand:- start:1715 stop:2164 length:450 start_codon:yes stop_codon:yes gene_type:complete